MQTTLLGLAIAIILALVTALVGSLFIDWNKYRGEFKARASQMTGLQLRVAGHRASATRAGSREFHVSSARRAFCAAVKGGNGGRLTDVLLNWRLWTGDRRRSDMRCRRSLPCARPVTPPCGR